ncbi:DUF6191 domain-containing protein [Streptomyces sp. MAR4 CNX-425]|uniref:DUF6191 domain-containing protein n=1 Tax=Streptomyces sp. MAR4 CNX-425 TaxID=3406343 RepID=UPI003B50D64A
MNIVAELFAPSAAHARRERERMELVVDNVGSGDPHRGPIDLRSGKVVIALGATGADPEPEDAVPPGAEPSDAVRAEPADAVPLHATGAEPADAVPLQASPADATPADATRR